jgi:shikimate dehydrogenase
VIDAHTRLAAVLGWPVEHSRSPALHNAAYRESGTNAVYVALPVPPEKLEDALRGLSALGFLGANVTVPHKERALALCDTVDDVAARVGAVNTLVPGTGGRLCGHNTDVGGFQDSLADRGVPVERDTRAVVLGAGGAARAVVVALKERGASVTVFARDVGRAGSLGPLGADLILPYAPRELEEALRGATLLVDATSTALSPQEERLWPSPIPLHALPQTAVVASLVYHREPALLCAARERGLEALDGSGMLIHQAARAFTLMTGLSAPVEAMRRAF